MSLVFAAITPHPPILIPTIGKDSIKKIDKTKQAMERLEEDLYLSKPDVIMVISPHGELLADAFTINYCSEFETDLREFGDLATKIKFKGELDLPNQLRGPARAKEYKTILISEQFLDHGTAIPLYYLTKHLPGVTIMPVGFCDLDGKTHLDFGTMLKDEIMKTTKRVAIIASCDLSHSLNTNAPAGFNSAGPEFDIKVQELLASHNTTGLLQMDQKIVADAAECGLRSCLILMGILRDVNYSFESYAYEGPFGVGYLTANFVI